MDKGPAMVDVERPLDPEVPEPPDGAAKDAARRMLGAGLDSSEAEDSFDEDKIRTDFAVFNVFFAAALNDMLRNSNKVMNEENLLTCKRQTQ